ncbi:hypothetical protein V6N11_070528 [Hibiscus sabdariffa]|uniref:Integrase catalytic domain-containing protein n=1 Tax=Hibiscus sabdariffa TaxID=183260 RepID=A0ABR2QFB9_9ROSI
MLVQEESQRLHLSGVSPLTDSSNVSVMFSSSAGGSQSSGKHRFSGSCSHCGIKGHKREHCYRLVGFPSDFKFNKKKGASAVMMVNVASPPASVDSQLPSPAPPSFTQEQYNQIINLLSQPASFDSAANLAGIGSSCLPVHDSVSWILDTGATDHILSDSKCLVNPVPCPPNSRFVSLPHGKNVPITHLGSFVFYSDHTLHNVLFVPTFRHNLLSISKLTRDLHCAVLFYPDFCLMQDLSTGRIKGIGKLSRGLYFFQSSVDASGLISSSSLFNNSVDASVCMSSGSTTVMNKTHIWHSRLGHAPLTVLSKLPDFSTAHFNHDCVKNCLVCPQAKQTCLPFPSSVSTSDKVFELIHLDLWGPYRISTHSGHRFFFTIVDDKTRMTWVYLLKLKSDVVLHLKTFFQYLQTQFSATVKVVRSDNGTEFFNSACSSFFNSLGIIHQSLCVHTPQQNGVAERKHRHLLEVARVLRLHSNVPIKFWAHLLRPLQFPFVSILCKFINFLFLFRSLNLKKVRGVLV